ncbi:MAG: hypothetical protein QNL94_05930 [Halioglobus sp.]
MSDEPIKLRGERPGRGNGRYHGIIADRDLSQKDQPEDDVLVNRYRTPSIKTARI